MVWGPPRPAGYHPGVAGIPTPIREPCLIAVHAFVLPEDVLDLANGSGAQVEGVEDPDAALERIQAQGGRFLLISSGQLNEADLQRFAARWVALATPRTSAVFVAEAPVAHRTQTLLDKLPRVSVVTQGPRFTARLVEAVAAALGLPVHERTTSGTWVPARVNGADAWFQLLGRRWGLLTRVRGLAVGDMLRVVLNTRAQPVEVLLKIELSVGPDRYVVQMIGLGSVELPILAGAFDAHLDARRGHVRFVVPSKLHVVARAQPVDGARRSYLRVLDLSIAGFRWLARGYEPGFEVGQVLQATVSWGHRRLSPTVEVRWRQAVDAGVELGVRIRTLSREDYDALHELIRQTQQRQLWRTTIGPEPGSSP